MSFVRFARSFQMPPCTLPVHVATVVNVIALLLQCKSSFGRPSHLQVRQISVSHLSACGREALIGFLFKT